MPRMSTLLVATDVKSSDILISEVQAKYIKAKITTSAVEVKEQKIHLLEKEQILTAITSVACHAQNLIAELNLFSIPLRLPEFMHDLSQANAFSKFNEPKSRTQEHMYFNQETSNTMQYNEITHPYHCRQQPRQL